MSTLNIKVSDRDITLLKDLYNNVFLSFYQIKEEPFIKEQRLLVTTDFQNCKKQILLGRLE